MPGSRATARGAARWRWQEAQRQQGGPQRKRLDEILVERGHITHLELQETLTHVNTLTRPPAPTVASATGDESLPDEVRLALADPRRRIGRYAWINELGRGGMDFLVRAPSLEGLLAPAYFDR